jgi:hypothetical protein
MVLRDTSVYVQTSMLQLNGRGAEVHRTSDQRNASPLLMLKAVFFPAGLVEVQICASTTR